jgi:4-amino-4-deoxy-L-arabinose transferase-like glycosyltransferase
MNIFLLAAASTPPVNAKTVMPAPDVNTTALWAVAALCVGFALFLFADSLVARFKRRRQEQWQAITNEVYTNPPADAKHRGPVPDEGGPKV